MPPLLSPGGMIGCGADVGACAGAGGGDDGGGTTVSRGGSAAAAFLGGAAFAAVAAPAFGALDAAFGFASVDSGFGGVLTGCPAGCVPFTAAGAGLLMAGALGAFVAGGLAFAGFGAADLATASFVRGACEAGAVAAGVLTVEAFATAFLAGAAFAAEPDATFATAGLRGAAALLFGLLAVSLWLTAAVFAEPAAAFVRGFAALARGALAGAATGDADVARSRLLCFCTDVSPIPVYRSPDWRIKAFVTSFGDQSMTCFDSCKPMPVPSAIPGGQSRPSAIRRYAGFAAAGIVAGLLGACTPAGDPGHPLRGAATSVGFATTVGEPKDFVRASRSGRELAYIPIGRGGLERPVAVRNAAGVKALESELDRQRDAVDATARRRLPAGAYGQPLPSVAAPPRPSPGAASGQPESAPVSASRLRQIRENADRAKQN